jgi:hypothetical protein
MAAKRGVLRPLVREHLEAIGSHLAWHSGVWAGSFVVPCAA